MRALDGAAALLPPQRGAAARLTRSLIAVAVVAVSAGTGYIASRVWPLPMLSQPTIQLAAPGEAHAAGVAPGAGGTAAVQRPLQPDAPVVRTSATSGLPSAAEGGLSKLPVSAEGQSAAPAAPSPDLLYRAPTEQEHGAAKASPATGRHAGALARRRTASARIQSTSGTAPGVVEFAPNPRPNQALRDFMSFRSRD